MHYTNYIHEQKDTDPRTSDNNDPDQGGKGPLYIGSSCGSCHNHAGRTFPTLFSHGGTGTGGFSSQLVYITSKNGSFFRQYGRVLHDQSVYGVEPEGKLKASYTTEKFQFPDGESYELLTPHYEITEWYADSIRPEDLVIDVRIPLRHVGMGQIMSLDLDELKRLAKQSNYPEYGISGKLNVIKERNKSFIGVGGNKAQHADLTVELGFSSDLGNCTSCHGSYPGAANLYLATGASYSNLVGRTASRSSKLRVKPGSAADSFIMDVLTTDGLLSPSHTRFLAKEEDLALLRQWIESGAVETRHAASPFHALTTPSPVRTSSTPNQ